MLIYELLEHQKHQQILKDRFGEKYQVQDLVICTKLSAVQSPIRVLRVLSDLLMLRK